MLRNIPLMLDITREVVKAVNVPVTVKTRLGWDCENLIITFFLQFFPDLIKKGHVYVLLFGAVMVIMMIYRPQGLISGEKRTYKITNKDKIDSSKSAFDVPATGGQA